MELSGVGVWNMQLGNGDAGEAAEAAAELEELGYGALWIPDIGGPVLESVENLLKATSTVTVATGILNLWLHPPAEVAEAFTRLSATYGERFLLGIGVSHSVMVDSIEPGLYKRPLAAMRAFLDGLDAAERPVPVAARVLAALGPKMLELAGTRARGAHPYLVTPEHTRIARGALGAGPLVLPEQTVVLAADRTQARAVAGGWLAAYLSLPNYRNSLLRLGFTEDEVDSTSDRVFDALIAWGDEDAVRTRVQEHRAAGADHVTLQVLNADQQVLPREEWRRLAAALF
ncbi:LLM class F420-dependent oxidoreductase [Frankia sp. AgKG'84/4]|uniref:LLM class F420-dependent oxidoreductase n=1 Tax=Frankia sp. AgKG'84/4 TaxID=573490 RepID=UPI00200BB4B5|nr:LLM class F420-dependent oxidoreductase [Frankia sp. AgKG'84/4]MCL9795911.1 LLM class F420-dependent oxidoreductase [Frankia sp. AgKG'84/4]